MGGDTIRALVVRKLGNPRLPLSDENCPVAETSWPRPVLETPMSVRVRVTASSVNFSTVLTLQGLYQEKPKLPFVPGGDFSGVVTEIGERVTRVKVGDRVCGFVDSGSFAEEFVADQKSMYCPPVSQFSRFVEFVARGSRLWAHFFKSCLPLFWLPGWVYPLVNPRVAALFPILSWCVQWECTFCIPIYVLNLELLQLELEMADQLPKIIFQKMIDLKILHN